MKQTLNDRRYSPPHTRHRRQPRAVRRQRPPHAAPSRQGRATRSPTVVAWAPRAIWTLGLGALLLAIVVGLFGLFHGSPVQLEIRPLPEGLDPVTYTNAVRIVNIAKGFVETQREVAAFQAELTPR